MPIAPLPTWIQSYDDESQAYYQQFAVNQSYPVEILWQNFVDDNTQGIGVIAPYDASVGTTVKTAFSPVIFNFAMLPPATALVLANAWLSYINAVTWSTPPPVPPFSVIASVTPSPVGVPAAYATLLAGLIVEFLTPPPPDGELAKIIKSTAIATLFRTATLASGVQITGLGIGGPPPPLTLPFVPVL